MLKKKARNAITILLIIFLFSCSQNTPKKQQTDNKKRDSIKVFSSKISSPVKTRDDDTIFYNDRFLIIGSKQMKLDYIPTGQRNNKIYISKGDTLFHQKG